MTNPEDSKIQLLKQCDLFQNFAEHDLHKLLEIMTQVSLEPQQVLFEQNGVSDCLYILLQGRLSVSMTTTKNNSIVVGEVGRGESVGEMGLFTGEPRSATVTAKRASILLHLSREAFRTLWQTYPDILFKIAQIITIRMQQTMRKLSGQSSYTNIVLLPVNPRIPALEFFERLKAHVDPSLNVKWLTQQDFSGMAMHEENILTHLNALEKDAQFVFYLISSDKNILNDCILEQADRIIFIDDGSTEPHFNDYSQSFFQSANHFIQIKRELVLIHPKRSRLFNTALWLKKWNFFRHHHISLDNPEDLQRLGRFITGKAVGLVLAGGGARVAAQVGAVKALMEANIPIDIVGGVSAGAINAACFSMREDFRSYMTFFQEVTGGLSFKEYTLPKVSVLSGKSLTFLLKDNFEDYRIEDLWKPMFCVSTDVYEAKQHIHREGLIWEALRASTSIPGVLPPMIMNKRLLVDGAVMNNLPVDVMSHYLEGSGRIIAIDISSKAAMQMDYIFPPVMTPWMWLKEKFSFGRYKILTPGILDIFLTSMLAASEERVEMNAKLADLYVKLPVSAYRLLDLKNSDKLFKLGYEYTKEALQHCENVDILPLLKHPDFRD